MVCYTSCGVGAVFLIANIYLMLSVDKRSLGTNLARLGGFTLGNLGGLGPRLYILKAELGFSTQNSSFFSYKTAPDTPDTYVGPQVVINSDRLVFNAKKDHVLISGQKSVNLSSNDSLNFDSKNYIVDAGNIKLGGQGAKEPLVKGENLYKKLDLMLTVLIQFFDIAQVQQLWPGGVPTSDGATSLGALTAMNALQEIQKQLEDIKSKVSKTV